MESDIEILQKIQSGQTELFGELYNLYSRQIYKYIFNRVSSKHVAEDLLSDTFFKALKGIDKVKAVHGTIMPWLYKIASNVVADHYRLHKPTVDLENAVEQQSGDDTSSGAMQQEAIREARKMLQTLDDRQREIVVMRLWDGLSYKEITEITGIKEGNCKMIFSRAISSLRSVYGPGALLLILTLNIWTK